MRSSVRTNKKDPIKRALIDFFDDIGLDPDFHADCFYNIYDILASELESTENGGYDPREEALTAYERNK